MDLREGKGLTPVESGHPITAATIDLTNRCVLACNYCNPAGTPILMHDFTIKYIEEIQEGDVVMGVVQDERYPYRLVPSKVTDVMKRRAPIVHVHTDKTSFMCTRDHLWGESLTRYKEPRVGNEIKHLCVDYLEKLNETDEYKFGYISAVISNTTLKDTQVPPIRGYSAKRIENDKQHYKKLLNSGLQIALNRVNEYLGELSLYPLPWQGVPIWTELYKTFTVHDLDVCTDDFIKGYIAGLFDSCGKVKKYKRIYMRQNDILKANTILQYLKKIGFKIYYQNNTIKIAFYNKQTLCKFLLYFGCKNIVKYRYAYEGNMPFSKAKILAVEKGHLSDVYSLETETSNYIAHGYLSHNCFSGCFKEYEGKDLDVDLGERIIDWLFNPTTNGNSDSVDISFWGGEPLIRWDVLEHLVLYAEEKAAQLGKRVTFGGTTNVVLLTPEKFEFLDAHNIHFLLSIDGSKEHHDLHRKFRNGEGSWETIRKNALEILKRWPNQQVRFSYSVDTIDGFIDDLNALYDMGFRHIIYSPVAEGNWTEERKGVLSEQWKLAAEWLANKIQQGEQVDLKFLNDACNTACGLTRYSNAPCGAGRGYVGIDVNGAIYSCHRFNKHDDKTPWHQQEYVIGHIDYGILNQKYRQRFINWDIDRDMPAKCKECPQFKKSCVGQCWATNHDINGDIAQISDINCYIELETAKQAQYLISLLGEDKIKDMLGISCENMSDGCTCYNVSDDMFNRIIINKKDMTQCKCNGVKYGIAPAPLNHCTCYNIQNNSSGKTEGYFDTSGTTCMQYTSTISHKDSLILSLTAERDRVDDPKIKQELTEKINILRDIL